MEVKLEGMCSGDGIMVVKPLTDLLRGSRLQVEETLERPGVDGLGLLMVINDSGEVQTLQLEWMVGHACTLREETNGMIIEERAEAMVDMVKMQ